jgi:SAM-dependent methyltransferase
VLKPYIAVMSQEVHGLGEFYSSAAGRVTARLLRARLAALWPTLPGMSVLGLGYASPYLRLWRGEAARCVALIPGQLRPWRWPRREPSRTARGAEDALPFPDLCFDRVLLVHGLENAENARRLLRETWRVLKDDGRLIVAVPNRLSLWAQLESTPFGHGQPYSPVQLEALLRRQLFRVARRDAALFVPPFGVRRPLRVAAGWERIGARLYPRFPGVMLLEAEKDIFAAVPVSDKARPRRVVVTEGV